MGHRQVKGRTTHPPAAHSGDGSTHLPKEPPIPGGFARRDCRENRPEMGGRYLLLRVYETRLLRFAEGEGYASGQLEVVGSFLV